MATHAQVDSLKLLCTLREIPPVYFVFDSTDLSPIQTKNFKFAKVSEETVIDQLSGLLDSSVDSKLELIGCVDGTEDAGLAMRRAQELKRLLVSSGANQDRVVVREDQGRPAIPEDYLKRLVTDDERSRARRLNARVIVLLRR